MPAPQHNAACNRVAEDNSSSGSHRPLTTGRSTFSHEQLQQMFQAQRQAASRDGAISSSSSSTSGSTSLAAASADIAELQQQLCGARNDNAKWQAAYAALSKTSEYKLAVLGQESKTESGMRQARKRQMQQQAAKAAQENAALRTHCHQLTAKLSSLQGLQLDHANLLNRNELLLGNCNLLREQLGRRDELLSLQRLQQQQRRGHGSTMAAAGQGAATAAAAAAAAAAGAAAAAARPAAATIAKILLRRSQRSSSSSRRSAAPRAPAKSRLSAASNVEAC